MSFLNLFKSDKTFIVISTLASAIAAIAACVVVFQAGLIFKSERETKRPYFSISKGLMEKNEEEQKYEFTIVFKNIGSNPAKDPRIKLLIKNQALTEDLFGIGFSFADEIPNGGVLYYGRENIEINKIKEDEYYIIVAVSYFDPILKKEFAQLFFQKWRTMHTKLERVVISQRDEILKNQGLELPLTDSNIIQQIWKQ